MRTERYRYTEWVYLDHEGEEEQAPIWEEVSKYFFYNVLNIFIL